MSKFKEFLMQGHPDAELAMEFTLPRFKLPFMLRTMTTTEHEGIRKTCMTRVKNPRTGQIDKELDQNRYLHMVIAACVVDPDFNDAELQAHYGVMGADALIDALFLPGELGELAMAVTALNRGITDLGEAVEEAKN